MQERVRVAISGRVPNVKLLGQIAHAKLPAVLTQYDVMVFPSYFDGFGQVILEAMCQGLAVVTTRNTCGPDIIKEGVDGLLISCGDQAELRCALARLEASPEMARRLGQAAALKARNYTWDAYGDRWNAILAQSQKLKTNS